MPCVASGVGAYWGPRRHLPPRETRQTQREVYLGSPVVARASVAPAASSSPAAGLTSAAPAVFSSPAVGHASAARAPSSRVACGFAAQGCPRFLAWPRSCTQGKNVCRRSSRIRHLCRCYGYVRVGCMSTDSSWPPRVPNTLNWIRVCLTPGAYGVERCRLAERVDHRLTFSGHLHPPLSPASIPSAVDPHTVERAWSRASRWSAQLDERP